MGYGKTRLFFNKIFLTSLGQEQKVMHSVTEQQNSPNRKTELELQKALLQTSALMRQRTGQPETKMDDLAFKRVNAELRRLDPNSAYDLG